MESKPLITIGITCFNGEDLIHRSIESAMAQSWPLLEILIVDDGSTDGSLEIIEGYRKKDARIRLIRHEQNKGFPAALNTIFKNAEGEFVALFDDDDTSTEDRIKKQYERIRDYAAQSGTDKILCYSNRRVFEAPDMTGRSYPLYAIGRNSPEPHGPMVADYLLWSTGEKRFSWGMFGSCTLMVARKHVPDLGGFDENFRRGAEWDLAVRAALQGAHFISVNEELVRQVKTISPDKANRIPLDYMLKLRRKHKTYLQQKGPLHYPAALCMAQARFAGSKGRKFTARFYRGINFLLTGGRS